MARSLSTTPPVPGRVCAMFVALCLVLGMAWAPDAAAQRVRAWTPPSADSLLAMASEARIHFQANEGDSVGGDNYRPYEIVSQMGRRLLSSIGRDNLIQAYAVETILDSLGLDTDVEIDPHLPYFVLLMVRNPFKLTAHSVGFYYWYRQDDLRLQGAMFRGGLNPRMRVWWTGSPGAPYSWGVVDETRGQRSQMGLTLLRLSPDGYYWNLVQYPGDGTELGGPGGSSWTDINRDGHPELITWIRGPVDSAFVECNECPKVLVERTFAERRTGFEMQDSRMLPTPYSTLILFARLLRGDQHAAAERLLADPTKLREALDLGWAREAKGVWRFVNAEPRERWPRWIAMEFESVDGPKSYIFRFTQVAGRWVIQEWEPVRSASRSTGNAP